MKPHRLPKDARELGIVWYLIPLLWVVAAAAGFFLVSSYPGLLADTLPAERNADASAFAAAPHPIGSEAAVPDAGSVFKDRPWEVSAHVDTF